MATHVSFLAQLYCRSTFVILMLWLIRDCVMHQIACYLMLPLKYCYELFQQLSMAPSQTLAWFIIYKEYVVNRKFHLTTSGGQGTLNYVSSLVLMCSRPPIQTSHSISMRWEACISYWSEAKVAQSFPTLCDPMDYTAHGILQARILE